MYYSVVLVVTILQISDEQEFNELLVKLDLFLLEKFFSGNISKHFTWQVALTRSCIQSPNMPFFGNGDLSSEKLIDLTLAIGNC